MTQQRRTALKELQKLDVRIQAALQQIREFDPLFEEIEQPALVLESELGTARNRLKEMRLEERRLEVTSAEKRERLKKLEERLGSVRNLREEAAVSAELDMVRRSLESDEGEVLNLIDSVRRGEERVGELETAYAEALAIVEPRRDELLAKREATRAEVKSLEGERTAFTDNMNPSELKVYNAIRGNGARAAVADLTVDGACGHCFGMVPLQHQIEIRHGEAMIRCEACGVILAAPEEKEEGVEEADGTEVEAEAASTEAAKGGDEDGAAEAEEESEEKE
jgi:predicted  nucleic acid-binding Zn-ribbon protein